MLQHDVPPAREGLRSRSPDRHRPTGFTRPSGFKRSAPMPVKLFVGGLSFTTSNDSLRAAFARYGVVESAAVMTDRETGRSRGFGFVEMATTEEAERALSSLNGANLDGRTIRVDKATPRGSGPRPSGP